MTQRLRYRDKCPIGEDCPAIDQGDAGMLNVTGYLPDGTEATVAVPESLIPEVADLNVPDLGRFISDHHKSDLLRIQTLSQYGAATDGDDFHRYLAGDPLPTSDARDAWFEQLRSEAARGKIRRNIHIVREPLSDYLRYQFEWGYAYTAAAGQKIRILTVDHTLAAAHLFKVGDYNVIDETTVVRLRYDNNGTRIGAVQVSVDAAESYAALAEVAWELGTDFATWWAEHPQYHRTARAA